MPDNCSNHEAIQPHDGVVPKLTGADIELGNVILGGPAERGLLNGDDAAQMLLAQIKGHARVPVLVTYPSTDSYSSVGYGYAKPIDTAGRTGCEYHENPQDRGRKYMECGGCIYTDLGHIEFNIAETLGAYDHVAAHGGMLCHVREAMNRANEQMPPGRQIVVLVNNSDNNNSWGAHLNVLVTRACWERIFRRRMHYLQFLASFQCCSIVLTGAGRLAAGEYQISSRAGFLGQGGLASVNTTFDRPICNSRDEALTGWGQHRNPKLARLHCIFFDSTMAQTATLLRVGMMQIVTAMIEQGQVPARLMLQDPVDALHSWSRDPSLQTTAPLVGGEQVTAVQLLREIFAEASRFVNAGRADGLIPDVKRIMSIWDDCLGALERQDMEHLARHIDWIAKKRLLESAIHQRGLEWDSLQMRYLDQIYASLGPEGLFGAMDRAGAMHKQVTDEHIARLMHAPPEDTRAWLRGLVIKFAPELIEDIDWDWIRIRQRTTSRGGWPRYDSLELAMPDPLGCTRQQCESALRNAPSLLEGLRALSLGALPGAADVEPVPASNTFTITPK